MRIGIDTYSYHRFLGETYPVQEAPGSLHSYEEILQESLDLGIDGISIETCFLDEHEESHCRRLVEISQEAGLAVILAWGHPLGLHGGDSDEAQADMEYYIRLCGKLGIDILRIVGSNRRLMDAVPRDIQKERVSGRLVESIKLAEDHRVNLAIENHQDFLAGDILEIMETVGSPNLGVNYDTGNSYRLNEDPLEAATLLAPYIIATHIKDVKPVDGGDPDAWTYFASVPAGEGICDLKGVIRAIDGADYKGFYAIELDYVHPDYPDEFDVMRKSIAYLKTIREEGV